MACSGVVTVLEEAELPDENEGCLSDGVLKVKEDVREVDEMDGEGEGASDTAGLTPR